MAAPRFYVAASLGPESVGETIALPEAVAHHAARVLRLAAGDAVTLFTGAGGEFAASLAHIDKRAVQARLERFLPIDRELPLVLTLVQAVVNVDAMDSIVRKAVELGAAAVCPVTSARSAPLPAGPRADKRQQHWQQVIVAACEQCGRNRLPRLAPLQPLAQWLERWPAEGVVCLPEGDSTWRSLDPAVKDLAIAIGPEGGWTVDEIAAFERRRFAKVRMGPSVLRADTAAAAALASAQAVLGEAVA